jgi:DNA recombination protein RmuC
MNAQFYSWLAFALLLLTAATGVSAYVLVLTLRTRRELPEILEDELERRHRAMLLDLHDGLTRQSDRMIDAQFEAFERLRGAVGQELNQTREATHALRLAQSENLAANRAELTEKLAEQGRGNQALVQTTLLGVAQQLSNSIEGLTRKVDERLDQISGKVHERLEEGFKKTNETFVSVMARLATIDEAQKKIDGLTTNVVSLQELLGDKRSRGAFGEVQLEALVSNILPAQSYRMQHTLSNGNRVDCALFLPEPTGMVAVDAKFPLENYHRMFEANAGAAERTAAQRQFKGDIRAHVEAIAAKYIVPGETSDGAVMFVPAEAVFAEIHAHHADLVDYALARRVWIVSPTTMMAVLNTARSVLKDVETRKQIHIIKDELGKLGKDFGRFDERMKKLAEHIRQANQDVTDIHVASKKISDRFYQIERVELDDNIVKRGGALEASEGT